MKKLLTTLSAFLIASIIYSQNLDTVFVRNLTLKYEEWSWCVDGFNTTDSLTKKRFKKLLKALDDANPNGFSTNITYDSLPGAIAMAFYKDYWRNTTARENMGTGIDTKLNSYTPLASFIAIEVANRLATFTKKRNNGRDTIE